MRLAFGLFVVLGCASIARAAPSASELLEKFECARCHDGLPGRSFPTEKHCVKCHQQILSGSFAAPAETLKRWQTNLHSLLVAPSLAGKLLDRDWMIAFLQQPHKVRPNLPASMPRLAITRDDAATIATLLASATPRDASAPSANVGWDHGRALYQRFNCGSCHRFTGSDVDAPITFAGKAAPLSIALAPDLRHTRARMHTGDVVRWLLDPAAQKPGTLMPKLGMSRDEATALAQLIVAWQPLQPQPARPALARLRPLARKVTWDEVNDKVFRRTCWHCHSQPDYALGDGGPGNTGGFGFPPRGLDLANATGASSGAFDETGTRQSIFRPYTNGLPRLVAALLARHAEERGTIDPNLRGMPLGLPALTAEQIQLVESWIAQGRPR